MSTFPNHLHAKLPFSDGRGFAEHQWSLLWSVSENAYKLYITIQPHWIFGSKFAYVFILPIILSSHLYATR